MIEVLVVDDSAFMRQIFKKTINKDPDLKVVATARNGAKAMDLLSQINPDVITLDVEMPVKNGIETLQEIINSYSIPVIMVSAADNKKTVMEALDIGAFDFIPKPSGNISLDIDNIKKRLISKIKASVNSKKPVASDTGTVRPLKKNLKSTKKYPIIAIGSSSGGPKALKKVLSGFPADLPAGIIIVQHMPAGFTSSLADHLDQTCNIDIEEAGENDSIKKGKALIAPGNYHMEINQNKKITLNQKPQKWGVRPCVDHMMSSAASVFKERVIGVILTGMGHDGGQGMEKIKKYNGYGIVQDESTALVYGMPSTTIEKGAYDKIIPLGEISKKIIQFIERRY